MLDISNLNSSINAILGNNMFLKDAELADNLNRDLVIFNSDLNQELMNLNSMTNYNIDKISGQSKDFANFLKDIRSVCDNYISRFDCY